MILQRVKCGVAEGWESVTGCKYGFNLVTTGLFSVLYEVSKMPCGATDCDDSHCYNGRKNI